MNNSTRIAHVITRMIIGGAQENTLLTVEGLQKEPCYEVDLITGEEIGPEGRLDLSRVKNVIFEPFLVRNIHLFKDFICLFRLFKLFKKKQYDIVHTHSSKAGIIARIAAKLAGIPVIIHTIHGLPFHPYQNKFMNHLFILMEKICGAFTRVIIVVAEEMKKKAVAHNIAPKDCFVTIYSGMDLDPFLQAAKHRNKIRKRLGIPFDALVVGKIARLFPLKGHQYILSIAGELVKKHPEIIFLWVGNGSLKHKLESEIQEKKLSNHFIFTGLVLPETIPEFLSAMDILVHVSLREGLARVLPQSLASGIPVVSFNIDGAKEVINDGINGFLINPEDADELKDKLLLLAKDPALRVAFTKNGRKIVDPFFRHEFMVRKIKELYESVLFNRK